MSINILTAIFQLSALIVAFLSIFIIVLIKQAESAAKLARFRYEQKAINLHGLKLLLKDVDNLYSIVGIFGYNIKKSKDKTEITRVHEGRVYKLLCKIFKKEYWK